MAKTKTSPEKKPAGITGTYKYDRATGEVVLVSDGVPKVASKGKAKSSPCGGGGCDPTSGMGGGCGGGACGL